MWDRLREIEARFEELTKQMGDPDIATDHVRLQALAKERAAIEEIVELHRRYREVQAQLQDARSLEGETMDRELLTLVRDEVQTLEAEEERLEAALKRALLPKDPRDERDVIVEIRAAAGGEEAALFAADLYRMYNRYADRRGWKTEIVSATESDKRGFREVIFEVHGTGAYSRLKYESGVHRVQRVPETEAQGRIHTSTATVAVLPEAEDVDVAIDENDLRIDVFHSGGAGGQNVNKVATAIRITHKPTGIVVVCQDERSQLKNRMKAMAVLRARLYDLEQRKQMSEMAETRRTQVGTGDRSEKIRTYNVPQDRVTDHRIGLTLHNLPAILDGDLDALIDAVATSEEARLLQEQVA
ncbi:MAG TPA: peptide chain release factor 1 [Dehalococcoidia bacterium]|nr:peptide chain release factor 1 [Dehalococcoidia bacterium]